ncbi:uncharacterized protein LOC6568510 [Drosophila grimshawi]|uniref:GH15720 n=1 Tax=Drosophila grimshawi TaxID=7222 RepID=B4JUI7_DROGR|nr:uncharacterized protein LOC6568510 [Drosophila grimshawi]EDV91157.1 GH15720 [Drosophila grimshawi]
MSTDEDSEGSSLKPTTSTPKSERAVVRELEGKTGVRNASHPLSHQRSFEARYSSIIQKQIWETTINKDAMERQLNAYFPFTRSASLTKDASDGFRQLLKPAQGSSEGVSRSLATTPTKQCNPNGV